MSIVTIPVVEAEGPGGSLYTLVDNLTNLNSQITRARNNGDLILNDENAAPEQKAVIDEANLLAILAAGGETENYLFAIEAPQSLVNVIVPVGVPYRTFKLGDEKTFKQWFDVEAEVWQNTTTNRVLFYTDPRPTAQAILKASEAELIRQINPADINFLTIAEAQDLVSDPDWVKI